MSFCLGNPQDGSVYTVCVQYGQHIIFIFILQIFLQPNVDESGDPSYYIRYEKIAVIEYPCLGLIKYFYLSLDLEKQQLMVK